MKLILQIALCLSTTLLFSQTPCENGSADGFPCNGLQLQSRLDLGDLSAGSGNDSWGWTDPDTDIEYAIVGLNNGTAFIDISNPLEPVYIGKLPTHTENSTWRDIKVYDNHAFIVSEARNHGMQVFDLTRLRNVNNAPVTFTEDTHLDTFGKAHNIVINEDTGFAYAVGARQVGSSPFPPLRYGGGPIFINIQDPLNPFEVGGFAIDGYSHDGQVINYNGPDSDYSGREIYIGSNEVEISIVDITNKNNPEAISTISYNNVAYTHQGWFTEDQRYFIVGDELDEGDFGFPSRTLIFDFEDLDNPQFHFQYFGPTDAIDHNGYVKDNIYYLANYTAGLRMLDLSDIANENIFETAFFDSHPETNSASFEGVWSVYPYFESGNIVISDINRGFLLVRDPSLSTPIQSVGGFRIYPNPASEKLTFTSEKSPISSIRIVNVLGQTVYHDTTLKGKLVTLDVSAFAPGMYLAQINNNTTKRLIIK